MKRQRFRLAATACIALAVAASSLVAAAPAQAAPFTARVGAIVHNAGDVTLTGTGDPGDAIEITTDDGPLQARVQTNGAWRKVAHVDDFGTHTFTVHDSTGSTPQTLTATTRPVTWNGLVVVREGWNRSLRFDASSGFEPGARIEFAVDGVPSGSTRVDRAGAVAYRITGVGFGPHTLTTTEHFDGAEQLRVNSKADLSADPEIDTVRVDPIARTVHVEGRGPRDTDMRFVDEGGAPWPLTDGQDWIANTDGTWSADLAYPSSGTRFMGIVAEIHERGKPVGSASTGATIPFPVTASVMASTPKRLTLTGRGEPGERLSFTAADGSAITDRDGNEVEPRVPGSGTWTVTLDPRRFTGPSVTAAVSSADGRPLGSATVTFR